MRGILSTMTRFLVAVSQRVLDSEQENDTCEYVLGVLRVTSWPVHLENRVDK